MPDDDDAPDGPPTAASQNEESKDDGNAEEYPPITPGGSLMLAWQPRDRPILLVGGGSRMQVAASRLDHLLNASATAITLIAPPPLHPLIAHRLATHPASIVHHPRLFLPSDLTDPPPSLLLTAIDDPAVSSTIQLLARAANIPTNVADVPGLCDFYFGAIHRSGPLQIMVSTNGNGPRLAATIRDRIAESLPSNIATAIANVGILRRKLRGIAPGNTGSDISQRMAFMSRVCDEWSFEQLAGMTDGEMDLLLAGYPDAVTSYDDLRRAKVELLLSDTSL
ncbi:hypothetical protein Dda_7843 [Drechslerella dactyloides]|uniref:precorrin-2 dehydrogenase n=1 Tax=Drechslerella dactyloides TaxID=74499 RepID=A0AAD6NFZ9_DREDA|nr:hypothetical protein Dda_7843 [Drechslerella dactyloides]